MRDILAKMKKWCREYKKTRGIYIIYCPRFGYGIFNSKTKEYYFYNAIAHKWDAYPQAKKGDKIVDTGGGIEFVE